MKKQDVSPTRKCVMGLIIAWIYLALYYSISYLLTDDIIAPYCRNVVAVGIGVIAYVLGRLTYHFYRRI